MALGQLPAHFLAPTWRNLMSILRLVMANLILMLTLVACGNSTTGTPAKISTNTPPQQESPTSTPIPTQKPTETPVQDTIKIQEVIFTHALNEDMTPTDETESFLPDQDIFISVRLDGNPKQGEIAASFTYDDQLIADAKVDLAQSRKDQGVIFVIGGDTYLGFSLSHDTPFPPSKRYQASLFINGEPAGEYPFQVTPPVDAIPTRLLSATLAKNVDADTYEPINPSTTFSADEQVFLAGRIDLGNGSTLTAEWYIAGERDDNATRVITSEADSTDVPFYFTYLPEGDWPQGNHKVLLLINDDPVGEYEFTITNAEK